MHRSFPRRNFLKSTLAASAAVAWPMPRTVAAEGKMPKLRMAVKYGMIQHDGSIEDKFNLIKKLGLAGVEGQQEAGAGRTQVHRVHGIRFQ